MSGTYAPDRARQLRLLLWVAVAAAVLLVLVAAVLVTGGGDAPAVLLVLVLPGLLLLALAATAQVLLRRGAPAAKPLAAATGVLSVLLALWLSATGVGLLFALLGVPLLLIAVLPGRDDDRRAPGAG